MRNKSLGDINKLNNGQLGGLPMRVGHRVGVVVGPPWMGWTPLPVPVLFVGLPAPPPNLNLKFVKKVCAKRGSKSDKWV